MKKLPFIVICVSFLICSCSSYKYTPSSYSQISPKLHNLHIVHTKNAYNDLDVYYNAFSKHIKQNFMNTSSKSYGTIEITQTNYRQQKIKGWGYLIFNCLSGTTLSLIGLPLCIEEYSPEYHFIIYDFNNEVIARYNYSSHVRFTVGLYYNGSKHRISALNDIMNSFRKDLIKDANYINSKLEIALNTEKQNNSNTKKRPSNDSNSTSNNFKNNNTNNYNSYPNSYQSKQQSLNYSRTKKQIQMDIDKMEKLKKDYEKYLQNEKAKLNSKYGSNYSAVNAFHWEKSILEIEKKIELLKNELKHAKD